MLHDILFVLSVIIILFTLIPFIRHDFWVFRVFEYPRLQKLMINLVLVIAIAVFTFPVSVTDYVISGALVVNLGYLVYLVFPFTVIAPKQIIRSRKPSGDDNLRLLIANVYQENRRSPDYHKLIKRCNPDVILMVETNEWWNQQMKSIEEQYPFQLKAPLENTYGMLFYSRFPIDGGEIKYLVKDDIPSIETLVELKSGKKLRLYCLHPEPPVPQENPRSTERDKEILLVAEKSKKSKEPVIVMGDLNDVAWSYTTELFGKISGLLDPRRGRGFFNSFNAKYFFMRFPLDHIFCSEDFTLTAIGRMPSCGSDHFPMCVNLQYDPKSKPLNDKPVADQEDKEVAAEKVAAT
ncbi:MAG: endonuclease/exonuclease/phosphatase family protein [Flavitalea sp.]